MNILQLDQIVKNYGDYTAVDNLSLAVPKGSIYGLLGPNGAGKTSLIRIITSITQADEGKVFLDGKPLDSTYRSQIGYMPEERGLYKKMKVGKQLMYLAQLKGLSKVEARTAILKWLDRFEIRDWWHKRIEELSKGMQQKIQFIATVIPRPKLLILDEPFSGLDPVNANLIKSEIHQLNKEGTSIIFSTHRMEQVEQICEYIALINGGRNILNGSVKAIKEQFKQNKFHIDFSGQWPEDLGINIHSIEISKHHRVVQIPDSEHSNQLLQRLISKGVKIEGFFEVLPSLNDIFIQKLHEERALAEQKNSSSTKVII